MSGATGLRGIYQDLSIRKDWENPSPKEVAQSLRKAHHVNRQLVTTVNELYDERKKLQDEMKEVKAKLGVSQLKNTVLTSLFTSAATSAIIGAVIGVARLFAHR